jgi:hypothetical protein
MKYPFHVYIPFSGNVHLLDRCISSILPFVREYSTYDDPIIILNNTKVPLQGKLEADGWSELIPPVPMVWATAYNWLLRVALANQEPFAFATHTDVEISQGAMEEVFDNYERVKDTKWYCIFANECLGMHNLAFFEDEQVWYDDFLFPMYYSDNHLARIAYLRGYREVMYYSEAVHHTKSHTIREDNVMRLRNAVGFPHATEVYKQIWGGVPGSETVADPYACGLLTRN